MAGSLALNFGNNPGAPSSYHSNQMGADYVISDNTIRDEPDGSRDFGPDGY